MLCVVTGGLGFVGSSLIRQLVALDWEIVVVDNMSRGAEENLGFARGKVRVVAEDVTNDLTGLLAQHNPQVIFHLAAMHFIPDCDADPAQCIRVNVDGTRSLLRGAQALTQPPVVVLASSAAVYAPSRVPHTERDALGPIDVYGYSKRWAEELTRAYAATTGATAGIARLFNVFGPGETNPHFIPSIICQLQMGETLQLGNITSRRDYVFVDDVADALYRLALYCSGSQTVTLNIGSGKAYSGHEVVQALAAFHAGMSDPTPAADPRRLRAVDRPMLLAQNSLASQILDWVPHTSFLEGLKAAWESPVGTGVKVS